MIWTTCAASRPPQLPQFRICDGGAAGRHRARGLTRIKALPSPADSPVRQSPKGTPRQIAGISSQPDVSDRRENVNSGTGKTHQLALGLAACQKGSRVRFTTAAALVNLLEARDRVQKQLVKHVDLGYVPLSKTSAELLFEIFSQRYEQASTLVTSESALQRMDRDLRLRTVDWRAARCG